MEQDKAFLGKEPIGKLLLKLALPTVAAQMINMLYNLVDRIYIGHIPNVGVSALAGVGVCMPLIMLVSAFAALVGYGGSPRVSIYMGKKDNENSRKDIGKLFCNADNNICNPDSSAAYMEQRSAYAVWREQKINRVCSQLYEHLCSRYDLCRTYTWHECVYYSAGIRKDGNVVCIDRCDFQYHT